MSLDWTVNPVAVAAFVLTCLGCVQALSAIFLTNWWTLQQSYGSTVYFGVWSREICNAKGQCTSRPGTEMTGGQEADFVSKVFATLAGFLTVCAVVIHILYFVLRRSMIRTAGIFAVGSACVFGLLSVFIFAGFYADQAGEKSLGVAFYLFVIACVVCGAAAAFTAWASVKKAYTMY